MAHCLITVPRLYRPEDWEALVSMEPLLSTQAAKEYGDHAVPNIHAMHGWQHTGKSTGHRSSRGHSIGMHSHSTTYKRPNAAHMFHPDLCIHSTHKHNVAGNLLNANMAHNTKES